jgi:hypothetical protein
MALDGWPTSAPPAFAAMKYRSFVKGAVAGQSTERRDGNETLKSLRFLMKQLAPRAERNCELCAADSPPCYARTLHQGSLA